MSDTLITIIAVVVVAGIMIIFPLMVTASQNDEIVQTAVQKIADEFANKVAIQGKITENDYDELIQKLHATGNTYNVELETKILDENPGKKTTSATQDMIGENVYYSEFTSELENILSRDPNVKYLKKGDYIIVSVENTNITLGTQLKNFFYKLVGKDARVIVVTSSAMVTNTANK